MTIADDKDLPKRKSNRLHIFRQGASLIELHERSSRKCFFGHWHLWRLPLESGHAASRMDLLRIHWRGASSGAAVFAVLPIAFSVSTMDGNFSPKHRCQRGRRERRKRGKA